MGETSISFWENYSAWRIRPIDRIINDSKQERNPTTPEMISDFAYGCQAIFYVVEQINPDVIILPLRGAAPIGWVLDELESINGKRYPKMYPRVGTHTDVINNSQAGYGWPTKEEIVRADLSIFDSFNRDQDGADKHPIQRPLLIDEVQSGSTLIDVARHLSPVLKDMFDCDTLYVVGAQDTRSIHRKKTHKYKKLVANASAEFLTATVNLPLFYIDKLHYLDSLLDASGATQKNAPGMLHTMHNTEAEALFKNLARGVFQPDLLLKAMDAVRREDDPQLTGEKYKDVIISRLYLWIRKLTVLNDDYHLKAANEEILEWLENLGRISLQRAK